MRTLLLGLLAATFLLFPALADPHGDCDSKGQPALGIVEIAGVAYVDDRNYVFGNGLWLYVEANGAEHLQRGGFMPFSDPKYHDICYDDSQNGPDMMVF